MEICVGNPRAQSHDHDAKRGGEREDSPEAKIAEF